MPNAPLLEIFILFAIAAAIAARLYTVLGRRTGTERTPGTGPSAYAGIPPPPPRPPASDPLAQGLFDIKQADRNFEAANFLTLARGSYEKIVTAFAAGDRAPLRPLLSDEVYGVFDSAIAAREARKEKVAFTFVGFRDARIVHAEMRGQTPEITLSFDGQFISATSNEAGQVIEGDPQATRETTDIWSFAREGANWLLVATSGGLP